MFVETCVQISVIIYAISSAFQVENSNIFCGFEPCHSEKFVSPIITRDANQPKSKTETPLKH